MTRTEFLAATTAAAAVVPCDLDGIACYLRPLTAAERTEAAAFQKVHGNDAGYQFLFVRSVCDAGGARLFADEDAPLVASFPVAVVEPVVERVLRLNRLGDDAGKAPSPTTPS